jgi:hypothetical protein
MQNQDDCLTYIICEARGCTEDQALELKFRRVCEGHNTLKKILPFDLVVVDKKAILKDCSLLTW